MKRIGMTLALLLAVSLATSPTASAATDKGSFDWHIAPAVNETTAPNGDVLHIQGNGKLNFGNRTATGGGTLTHTLASGGTITADWTATGLLDFQFYGCGPTPPFPSNFCGGKAMMTVHITAQGGALQHDGTLWVFCLLGSPPAGAQEGVRLNVPGIVNFNNIVDGMTVFIDTSP